MNFEKNVLPQSFTAKVSSHKVMFALTCRLSCKGHFAVFALSGELTKNVIFGQHLFLLYMLNMSHSYVALFS